MDLDERFALRRALALLAGGFHLRNRNAEACGQMAHRFLKADLLLQLDKLEHVTADAAAETVEEPAIAIDVERWRFLAVKRAEALVGRAGLAQRHRVRD